jgi:hypothetical protein
VRRDRIDAPFAAPAAPVDVAPPPAGRVTGSARFGYLLSARRNDSHTALNRLLAAGERVHVAPESFRAAGRTWQPGTWVIEAGAQTRQRVDAVARELGLELVGVDARPSATLAPVRRPRVALYRPFTANMDEGWTRFVLGRHEFDLTTVTNQDIRTGDLTRFDVIILADQTASSILDGHAAGRMPEEFAGGLGDDGAAALRAFVRAGGRLLAFDGATDFVIAQFELPVSNAVAAIGRTELYIPGSLIRMDIDPQHPVAWGMQPEGAAFFQESRAYEVPESAAQRVDVIARYAASDLLLSGWEIGAGEHIAGRAAAVRVGDGAGDVVLIGFRPQFRAWPTGTFKLIFNSLVGATLPR